MSLNLPPAIGAKSPLPTGLDLPALPKTGADAAIPPTPPPTPAVANDAPLPSLPAPEAGAGQKLDVTA
jgi:hypothetical protein